MNIQIRKIKADADLERGAAAVARLAEEIWTEHYTPIIGAAQVDYMLAKFQSPERIADDIARHNHYYYVAEDADGARPAGYCAAYLRDDCLFLSKLYVRRDCRGGGIARRFLELLISLCAETGTRKIRLTVNKDNAASIAAYRKLGFTVTDSVKADIGGGFFMDDYVMERIITGEV